MEGHKVFLVPDPTRDLVEIYLVRDALGHRQYAVPDTQTAGLLWVDKKDEGKPEPFTSLPTYIFEALVAEGNGLVRSSDATQRHLQDAIDVRDKLMELVVRGWRHVDQPQPPR